MNKFLSLLVLAFLAMNTAFTQVLTVRDQVTQPLEMVQLYNSKLAQVLSTNHKGQADITALQGIDSIEVRLVVSHPPDLLKLLYQLSQHLSATAGIENVTDQRYRPNSSGIAAPGRNFLVSLRAIR